MPDYAECNYSATTLRRGLLVPLVTAPQTTSASVEGAMVASVPTATTPRCLLLWREAVHGREASHVST